MCLLLLIFVAVGVRGSAAFRSEQLLLVLESRIVPHPRERRLRGGFRVCPPGGLVQPCWGVGVLREGESERLSEGAVLRFTEVFGR